MGTPLGPLCLLLPLPRTGLRPVSGELAEWKMFIQNENQTVRSWPRGMCWVPEPSRHKGGRPTLSQT